MKIPVTRGKIGSWRYYIGVMNFKQISDSVTSSINQLFTATCLDDLLQRELTNNFESIKRYLLKEKDRFFNAIILALYDGDPQWLEVEFRGEEQEFTNVGFLQLTGKEVIFPVDGQHRVAGIIEAVKEKPELEKEQVPVIFIAHENTDLGRKKTRKLFSTLNRRAKPVGQNENIALDEDDVCAIITRDLLLNFDLFKGNNIVNSLGKQIPVKNETAFTSLITLYQCVDSIVRWNLSKEKITGKKYQEFLLYRPTEEKIESLRLLVFSIMQEFVNNTNSILEFMEDKTEKRAAKFRNKEGGNLLFRPIALTEYFNAALNLFDNSYSFSGAFSALNSISLTLADSPWKGLLWDGTKMINRVSRPLIRDLLIYMVNKDLISSADYGRMIKTYSSSLNIDEDSTKLIFEAIST